MKRLTKAEVEREIAALDTLDTKALQQKWSALYQRDPPSRIRAGLLRLGVAYRLQDKAFGGLKPKTIRHLRTLAAEFRSARSPAEILVEAEVSVRASVVQTLKLGRADGDVRGWLGVAVDQSRLVPMRSAARRHRSMARSNRCCRSLRLTGVRRGF